MGAVQVWEAMPKERVMWSVASISVSEQQKQENFKEQATVWHFLNKTKGQ